MFCPRCGTENDSERSYCRSCGQALSSVRLALEGRVDEAITTLKNEQNIHVYRIRLIASVLLILAALATLLSSGRFGFANVGSAAILLIIALLFFLQLALKSRRVGQLLNPSTNTSTPSLRDASTKALNNPTQKMPVSVAESTTLKLNSEESKRT
ncbi:MAG TPA: zinc ribbon domain-containing protein [Pyrinomonadaceae bacterium]|nr:zinc ribbon domain-containing protein [Pyrinomonadaceae bacterium]